MNIISLIVFDFRCQKRYQKDIKAICKWLDISKPNRICFLPDELKKRNCRGEYHYQSRIIIIYVPDYLARTHNAFIVETIAHELIHHYQNDLGIVMSATEIVEKSAEALTNCFMEDWRYSQVKRGAVRKYISRTAGGQSPR